MKFIVWYMKDISDYEYGIVKIMHHKKDIRGLREFRSIISAIISVISWRKF